MPQFLTTRLSELRKTPCAVNRITTSKRIFDLLLAFVVVIPVILMGVVIAICLFLRQGGPVFYRAERIGQNGQPFHLWKFRTMSAQPDGGTATGGDKAQRITPMGRHLRSWRLDELPQLWNIFRGELSFVGPRPPLRRYVDRHADLYAQVLLSRPGLTGLATVKYRRAEGRILHHTQCAAETDRLYSRHCVPRKARLDLIYQRHASLRFDLAILWQTICAR